MTKPYFLLAGIAFASMPSVLFAQTPLNAADRIEKAIKSGDSKVLATELDKLPKAARESLVKSLKLDMRIVGGLPATVADFPWQVALVRGAVREPGRSQFCGGTLIAADIVITAAHCIDNAVVRSDPALVNIVAGASAYEADGERIGVKALVINPKWNRDNYDYDVAILRLKSKATIGQPIRLGTTSVETGTKAWVSGWGATVEGGRGSSQLMAVEVPVVDTAICNAEGSYSDALTGQMLCAGEREGGKDSCQGDSGGPLVTGAANVERLIGIVSWGEGCARRLKYGVYTDVSSIAGWVTGIVGNHAAMTDPTNDKRLFTLPSQSKSNGK